ncbi:MAG: hypothetical protein KC431_14690, partial [Myxococcales bacterium]|nr:hypothetical protein [Myxococcales bacterium]
MFLPIQFQDMRREQLAIDLTRLDLMSRQRRISTRSLTSAEAVPQVSLPLNLDETRPPAVPGSSPMLVLM